MILQIAVTSLICALLNCDVIHGLDTADADQILKDENDAIVSCGAPCHAIELSDCMEHPTDGTEVCACDPLHKHYLHESGRKCVRHQHLQDRCSLELGLCVDRHTECLEEISPYGILLRCQCTNGTQQMRITHGHNACGTPISGEECDDCTKEGGTCYRYFEEDSQSEVRHCHCPGSMSGDNCENKHAHVTCMDETMFVCYNEHPGHSVSNGTWLEVESMGGLHATCMGQLVGADDPICSDGDLKLALPLAEEKRTLCDTARVEIMDEWVVFENMLAVHKDENSLMSGEIIVFKTFCQVQAHVMMVSGGIQQSSTLDGAIAHTTFPALNMIILDTIGNVLTSNSHVVVRENIRLRITLDDALGFTEFVVRSCILSSERDYQRASAVTKSVIRNGCPTPGQNVINSDNMFTIRSPTSKVTGLFEAEQLASGMNLFIHCDVKVCMPDVAETCSQPDCTAASERRRRAAGDVSDTDKVKDVELTKGIVFAEPSENLELNQIIANKGTFITALCVILLVVAIVIVVVSVFGVRYWRRRQIEKNKLVVPQRAVATGNAANVHPGHTVNRGFVPEEMRSYASQNVL